MGTNNQLCYSIFNLFIDFPFLPGLSRACEQHCLIGKALFL